MGCEEVHCQLCGVTFAIGRVRRADEPPEAGWDYFGDAPVGTDYWRDEVAKACGKDSGCEFFNHEHLAGPECVSQEGYSGYQITVEEMQGCRDVMALLRKPSDWRPEPSDQDFELTSNYFLSGVGDGSPDGDPLQILENKRHGVENVRISDYINTLESLTSRFRDGFRGYDVKSSCEAERWLHQPGCEYLVANPIDIPRFPMSLERLRLGIHERPKGAFRWSYDSVPEVLYNAPPTSMVRSVSDPFIRLPHEILQTILAHCDSQSLANMRLVTQACRQLRPILFRNLLAKEMPWIWELEDLDIHKYDWREVFQHAKTRWMSFKGLRNRRRIWSDIEEILNQVERYRRQGVIRDDGTWPENFRVPGLSDGPLLVRRVTKQVLDDDDDEMDL
ncbi:hypothetical protein FQN55_005214 [Onygenales sp. PD_40]|nr:hypothetical protein FQN55_005214 [Onygenales sp. PD_40]KAK2792937.1 hypothetical protein FQN52_002615 [Onygenales sp. PD_12]KAK2805908.1 hypothetical protein FQN51_008682 [Onygenales sp. PD_10]